MTPTDTPQMIQGPAALPLPILPPWSLELQRILGGELATRKRGQVPSGISCYFYELTLPDGSKVGAKLYREEALAVKIRGRQRLAAWEGWAPATGDTFSFDIYGSSGSVPVHGYLSEVAEVMSPFTREEKRAVRKDFLRRFGYAGDIGPKNCGRVRGGYVAIDFDDASTSDGGYGCSTCRARREEQEEEDKSDTPPPALAPPPPFGREALEPPLTSEERADPLPAGWRRNPLGDLLKGGVLTCHIDACSLCRAPGMGVSQFRKDRSISAIPPLVGPRNHPGKLESRTCEITVSALV